MAALNKLCMTFDCLTFFAQRRAGIVVGVLQERFIRAVDVNASVRADCAEDSPRYGRHEWTSCSLNTFYEVPKFTRKSVPRSLHCARIIQIVIPEHVALTGRYRDRCSDIRHGRHSQVLCTNALLIHSFSVLSMRQTHIGQAVYDHIEQINTEHMSDSAALLRLALLFARGHVCAPHGIFPIEEVTDAAVAEARLALHFQDSHGILLVLGNRLTSSGVVGLIFYWR